MATVTISMADRSNAHTEAAIYAEGTPFTVEELFVKWIDACKLEGRLLPKQSFYEQVLRDHPDFEESWLE